jgi:hypothetical protein
MHDRPCVIPGTCGTRSDLTENTKFRWRRLKSGRFVPVYKTVILRFKAQSRLAFLLVDGSLTKQEKSTENLLCCNAIKFALWANGKSFIVFACKVL